jgi:hypothetical protein
LFSAAIMLNSNNVMSTRTLKGLTQYAHKNAKVCQYLTPLWLLFAYTMQILYAPASDDVQHIMAKLANDSNVDLSFILGFPSYEELHQYYRANSTTVFAGNILLCFPFYFFSLFPTPSLKMLLTGLYFGYYNATLNITAPSGNR